MSKRKAVALLVLGVLIGLMLMPLTAQADLSASILWNKFKARTDARYVQAKATAYAFVLPTPPTLDVSRTMNFTAVSRPNDGIYCLTPASHVDLAAVPGIATPEWEYSSGSDLQVYVAEAGGRCSPGDLEVITRSSGAMSNSTAFTVWVP